MNNIVVGINKFIKNKNTVTVIGIILILVLLYFGYTRTVNTTIQPIEVPVAARDIGERTQITENDVKIVNAASILVSDKVFRSKDSVVGMYTNLNVTIPEGSMFYSSWLIEKDKIPGNWIEEINTAEGYEAYYLSTNSTQTFGNNVTPGSYIDLYMSVKNDEGELMYGRLLKDIKVLVVHDSSGNDVFADASKPSSPSKLGFEVSHDFYVLLYKAEHMEGVNLEISPRGSSSKNKSGIFVSSQTLRDYIDTHTASITDEIDESTTSEDIKLKIKNKQS